MINSKFRISANEMGLYNNIPKYNGKCTVCNTEQVEDTVHFFINCPAYRKFRKRMKKINKNFNSISDNKILISNSNSLITIKDLIEYTNKCQAKSGKNI